MKEDHVKLFHALWLIIKFVYLYLDEFNDSEI